MGRRSGRFGGSGRDRRSAARRNRVADRGARCTACGGSRSAIAARSVGDGGNAQNGARRGRRSLVVLNRVPPRSRLTEDIAADLASAGTPIADLSDIVLVAHSYGGMVISGVVGVRPASGTHGGFDSVGLLHRMSSSVRATAI